MAEKPDLGAIVSQIPWGVWVFMLMQSFAAVVWAVHLGGRMTAVEKANTNMQIMIDHIDRVGTAQLGVIQERQDVNTKAVVELRRQTDWVLQMLSPHPVLPQPIIPK